MLKSYVASRIFLEIRFKLSTSTSCPPLGACSSTRCLPCSIPLTIIDKSVKYYLHNVEPFRILTLNTQDVSFMSFNCATPGEDGLRDELPKPLSRLTPTLLPSPLLLFTLIDHTWFTLSSVSRLTQSSPPRIILLLDVLLDLQNHLCRFSSTNLSKWLLLSRINLPN